jgi:CheY-like chemotaxis protein
MKGTLFLFQWHAESAQQRAAELREDGWEVSFESEDGARGGKAVFANPPDVIVCDLARRPSHSRETAEAIQWRKATRDIPIVFVDGTEEAIAKTQAKVKDGIYTTSAELKSVLERFVKHTAESNSASTTANKPAGSRLATM